MVKELCQFSAAFSWWWEYNDEDIILKNEVFVIARVVRDAVGWQKYTLATKVCIVKVAPLFPCKWPHKPSISPYLTIRTTWNFIITIFQSIPVQLPCILNTGNSDFNSLLVWADSDSTRKHSLTEGISGSYDRREGSFGLLLDLFWSTKHPGDHEAAANLAWLLRKMWWHQLLELMSLGWNF